MNRLFNYCVILVVCLLTLTLSQGTLYAHEHLCKEPFSGIVPDGKYDFSMALFPGGFEKFSSDWPRIFASGVPVKKNAEGKTESFPRVNRSGRVIIAPPRYIVTNNHIVDVSFFAAPRQGPFGPIMEEVQADGVTDDRYWLKVSEDAPEIPLTKVKVFPEADSAFFEISDSSVSLDSPLPFGKSGDLCLGHTIYILGSPGVLGTHIREGVISAFHLIPQALINRKVFGPLEFNLLITVSLEIDRGDSGSPLVAFRDGKPEIIGIASNVLGIGGLMHGFSMIVPIDEIVRRVRDATGIDLKEKSDNYFHKP